MRAAVQRWAIERVLHAARAALARAETPERVRELMARAASAHCAARDLRGVGAFRDWRSAGLVGRTPAGAPQGGVILYFHGGGFIAECSAIHDPLLAAIGRAAGARGLMVDYRLAPEHPFPAATEDGFATWNHLLVVRNRSRSRRVRGRFGRRQSRARHCDAGARRGDCRCPRRSCCSRRCST